MSEAQLQSAVIKWLRSKGCYVIKTKPGPGVPMGCPDVMFMLEGFWGGIECKASAKSIFQPLQKETIHKMNTWSYARVCHPDNWDEIRSELEGML